MTADLKLSAAGFRYTAIMHFTRKFAWSLGLWGTFFSVSAREYISAPISLREKTFLVMNRLGFGPRPSEVNKIGSGGEAALQRWINQQLHAQNISDTELDQILAKHTILNLSVEELQTKYNKEDAKDNPQFKPDEIRKAWSSAKLIRAIESQRPFQEKLVDFWFNHFNVDQRKGKLRWSFGPYERDAIRPYIFGKFIDLLRATARHPAMLFYLDNHLSRAEGGKNAKDAKGKGINENYARELMELHTLGVNGGYGQNDILEVARILTGWSIAQVNEQPVFEFKEKWHDFGEKNVMHWQFPAGVGEAEGEKLLVLLANHPSTAHHLSTLLAEAFVASPAPKALVDHLTKVYLNTGGDLSSLYRALVQSPQFSSRQYLGAKVKDHFTWVVSVIRALGGEILWQNQLVNELNKLDEPLYQCAPPTGYAHRPEDLVNSGVLVSRLNLALKLAANRIDGVYVNVPRPPARSFNTAQQVLDYLVHEMDLPPLSSSTRDAILSELKDNDWKIANGQLRPFILARLVGLLLASPEFQRI